MSLSQDIRLNAERFLTNELSLAAFEEWLVPETWDVRLDQDDEASVLTREIKRSLFEMSSGHRSEAQFREDLVALLQAQWAQFSPLDLSNELLSLAKTTSAIPANRREDGTSYRVLTGRAEPADK